MNSQEETKDPYGAIQFGEFRKYMQNKQSKLKKQQRELGAQASQELPQIFTGTSIYINGYSDPPSSELRRMILQHGGDYQHYLKRLSVTHIIATNLTNAKLQEFRAYKVVKPEWILESIEAQQMLPWQNYRLISRSTKQKELPFTSTAKKTVLNGEELNATILANEWARESSAVNPEFIKRYYETSRLHYLSTWKEELKEIVGNLEEKYKSKKLKGKQKKSLSRVVMHIDFDCFFASVGLKDRPHLRDLPVAVSHSKTTSEKSMSDIASCNYVARSYGIRNGMTIGMANRLCPKLQLIPYEFEKYRAISEVFYEIIFQYADEIQAVSVDEALLEIGSHITALDDGQEEVLATKIRDEIRQATGCEASIGIGANILIARMSTKKAKPAGQYFCKTKQDVENLLANQSVIDLPGVGYAIQDKLKDMKVKLVADMKNIPLYELQSKLGTKMGQTLYNFSRGIDDRPLTTNQQRQSVSAEVSWGVRFENKENEKAFVDGLSKEVSDRLIKHEIKGKTITLKVMKRQQDAAQAKKHLGHGRVDSFSKSYTLGDFTDDPAIISKHVYSMLESFQFPCADIRGIGIQITKLNNQEAIPSDQGKLMFKTRVISNTEGSNAETEPGHLTQVTGPNHSIQKEGMEVNMDVYKELPESVQRELASNYNLKFIQSEPKDASRAIQKEIYQQDKDEPVEYQAESNSSTQKDYSSLSIMSNSPPDLPPWSQLDPSSLLAMPDKMREQVLRSYGHKSKLKKSERDAPGIPLRSPDRHISTLFSTNGKTSQSRSIFKANRSKVTTMQLFPLVSNPSSRKLPSSSNASPSQSMDGLSTHPQSRFRPVVEFEEELPFDADVWNELPKEMRDELLAEHHRLKRRKVQEEQNQDLKNVQKEHLKKREGLNQMTLELLEEPSLQGSTDINDLRKLLSHWVLSNEDKPELEDVKTVSLFLKKLISFSNLEKAQLLVAYLKYLTKGYPDNSGWKQTAAEIQEVVSDSVTIMYGCPLNF